jgi:putative tricarboxylic transport membrane protein
MFHNLFSGLADVTSGTNVIFVIAGAFIGVVFGVIPGIATPVILSIMLVFTMHTSLDGTIALFLGTYAGSYFSASITSILLNTPAHPEAFAVTFDGYPMARQGRPARALGISAASTCVGGLVGCIVLAAFLPVMNSLPYLFHPPEYVALILLAMLMVGMLGCDSVGKAIIAAGLGFMVASVGTSSITGVFRYTFNNADLASGFSLVAVALGLFAIPQMVMVFGTGTAVAKQDMSGREVSDSRPVSLGRGAGKEVWAGVGDAMRLWRIQVQSGLVGVVTGVVPGIGGFAANFLSYGLAQQTSRGRRKEFGTGIPEGIVAAEGSSLSKEAGSLIPILSLGIPGSVGGALFLAALVLKGVQVGYGFTTRYPVLPYDMVWTIALTGIIGTVIGVISAPLLAKVTRVPGPVLVPFIFCLSALGPYLSDVTFTSIVEVASFAFVGLALRRLGYPIATFVLGLVLGPTFETNIYLTRGVYPGLSFITARPLADIIILIGIGFPLVRLIRGVRARRISRRQTAELNVPGADATDAPPRLAQARKESVTRRYPVLAMVVTVLLIVVSAWYAYYGYSHYNFATATMPVFGALLVLVPSALRLPSDTAQLVRFLRPGNDDGDSGAAAISVRSRALVGVHADADGEVPEGPPPTANPLPAADSGQGLAPIKEKAWGLHGQYTREVVALLLLLGLVELIYLFGFLYALPVFCILYALLATRRIFKSWTGRITFAAASAAAMWLMAWEGMRALHIVFISLINLPG